MLSFLRFLTFGNPNPKQIAIRAIGLIILVVVMVVWGINSRSNPPQVAPFDGSVTVAPVTDVSNIQIGASVTGSLAEGERHEWQFEAVAGQHVNIRVFSDWDSTVSLGGGGEHAIDFNSGGDFQPMICNYLLDRGGTYSAYVSGAGASTPVSGDYTLSIEAETYVEERPIIYGETVQGQVTTCDGDFYTIAVEQGDQLAVTVTPQDGALMLVGLYPQRGNEGILAFATDATAEDGTPLERIVVDIEQDATLYLSIRVPVDDPEAAYTFSVSGGAAS